MRRGREPASKLGTKYSCFSCEAKFYDLNRPEPICPKCGTDQRDKPKEQANTRGQPAGRRAAVRPMAPLLDDDESVARDEEIDLGVQTPEASTSGFLDSAVAAEDSEDDSEEQ